MVSTRAVAAAGAPDPIAPASPEPKRPRQRGQEVPSASQQDVTLHEVAGVVAQLHSKFARDETFVAGIHDAVDHNAAILAEAMQRLMAAEQKLVESAGAIGQLAVDAKANDGPLDSPLAVSSQTSSGRRM